MEEGKSFVVFKEWIEDVEALDESERAELILAMFRYANGMPLPEMQRSTELIWLNWRRTISRNVERWDSTRNKRKAAAEKRWGKVKDATASEEPPSDANASDAMQNDANHANASDAMHDVNVNVNGNVNANVNGNVNVNANVNGNVNDTTGPRLDEVVLYYQKMGFCHTSPEQFFDYYTAVGWIDADGKPIKNWKAVLRGWETKDATRKTPVGSHGNKFNNFEQRKYNMAELERMLLSAGTN